MKLLQQSKIINDPVHGFITIPKGIIEEVLNHKWFLRLRRIKQLGMAEFVYPGAVHSRFNHAIGAMYLMGLALDYLIDKGVEIEKIEYEAALLAALLHDIGHGPFSHTLENTLLSGVHHEELTKQYLISLQDSLGSEELALALKIFEGKYHRPFFHQLVSGQLDVDRLDYLKRDCFFTGVIEGGVACQRIVRMLNVRNEHLVVEEKGIYSLENFLVARRVMYWQVYLHHTSIGAERMLVSILNRVRDLSLAGEAIFATSSLRQIISRHWGMSQVQNEPALLEIFADLDDTDIWASIKEWAKDKDPILSRLSQDLLSRQIFACNLSSNEFDGLRMEGLLPFQVNSDIKLGSEKDLSYLYYSGKVVNTAYLTDSSSILILMKNGDIKEITSASDSPHLEAMKKDVTKYYFARHRDLSINSLQAKGLSLQ